MKKYFFKPRPRTVLSPSIYRARRWLLLLIALITALVGFLFLKGDKPPAPSTGVEYFDRLIALPEDKIDIGVVALNLAKDFHPGLDVDAYSRKIDELVAKVRDKTGGALAPDVRIRTMNTVIYKQEGYGYDFDAAARKDRDSGRLNYVLDTKRGSCLGLTILYLAVAQRLGYPIYPVVMPHHPFLRYIGGDFTLYNIEATNGGGYSPDGFYIDYLKPSMSAVNSGVYLRTSTYREFVGWLLDSNAMAHEVLGQKGMMAACLEASVCMSPKYTPACARLAFVLRDVSQSLKGKEAEHFYQKALGLMQHVYDMGDSGIIEMPPEFKEAA